VSRRRSRLHGYHRHASIKRCDGTRRPQAARSNGNGHGQNKVDASLCLHEYSQYTLGKVAISRADEGMEMSGLFLVVALVTLLAGNAQAQERSDTGGSIQQLREWCKRSPAHEDFGQCMQYIVGVSDVMRLIGNLEASDTGMVRGAVGRCGTAKNYNDLVQAFVLWSDKRPDRWSEPRRYGVLEALKEKWPCT
jgi:hypothetical protein